MVAGELLVHAAGQDGDASSVPHATSECVSFLNTREFFQTECYCSRGAVSRWLRRNRRCCPRREGDSSIGVAQRVRLSHKVLSALKPDGLEAPSVQDFGSLPFRLNHRQLLSLVAGPMSERCERRERCECVSMSECIDLGC